MDVDVLHERVVLQGARVVWADLGSHRMGLYQDDMRKITLNLCLTGWQERSTLAHELSHATWRDRPVRNQVEHEARERRADAEAARTLINARDYEAAEAAVGPDVGALAVELGVSRWVVEAWQREADAGRGWTRAL